MTWIASEVFKLLGLVNALKEASPSGVSAGILRMMFSAPGSYELDNNTIVIDGRQRKVHRRLDKNLLLLKLQTHA